MLAFDCCVLSIVCVLVFCSLLSVWGVCGLIKNNQYLFLCLCIFVLSFLFRDVRV